MGIMFLCGSTFTVEKQMKCFSVGVPNEQFLNNWIFEL